MSMSSGRHTVAPLSPPLSEAFKIELVAREEQQRKALPSDTSGMPRNRYQSQIKFQELSCFFGRRLG